MGLVEAGQTKARILEATGCTLAVNDATFAIERHEIFVIMGLSGSGKSTVLRCLNRLTEATSGEIRFDGKNLLEFSASDLCEVRRQHMSMVFQQFALLPHRSVIDNVAFGLEIQGLKRADRWARARDAIRRVGLEAYEAARVQALSGGMRQRVGLARALAGNAEVLLMDEAFSALDPLIRTQMQDELLALQAELRKTIVFITHDLDEALKLGDRIAIMKDGEIVQIDTPTGILTHPADDYVRAFVSNVDRTRVLTAGTIMDSRDTGVVSERHSPAEALKRMRHQKLQAMLVVDDAWRPVGVLSAEAVRGAQNEGTTDLQPLLSPMPQATVEATTPVRDLLTPAAEMQAPLAILDEAGRLIGTLTHHALLKALANPTVTQDAQAESSPDSVGGS